MRLRAYTVCSLVSSATHSTALRREQPNISTNVILLFECSTVTLLSAHRPLFHAALDPQLHPRMERLVGEIESQPHHVSRPGLQGFDLNECTRHDKDVLFMLG